MAESDTLLAHLAGRFPGNQEDIATEALAHILVKSAASLEAFNDVVQSGVRDVKPIKAVRTQVLEGNSIPDMVGFDDERKERVIVEVKFWAGLTDNQPNAYLNRLPDDGPAVLMFLAPDDRIKSLWPDLRGRVERQHALSIVESERKCFLIGDTRRHLMLVSWTGLLDSMAARSGDAEEPAGIGAEIRQLRGLARYAGTGVFKPISRDEQVGEDSEQRKRDFERLIEGAAWRGVEQGWASRKGSRVSRYSGEYGRYIYLSGLAWVWFGVQLKRLESTGESPLWVRFVDDLSKIDMDKVRVQLGASNNWANWAPVNLKREVEYSEALNSVVDSLRHISEVVASAVKPAQSSP